LYIAKKTGFIALINIFSGIINVFLNYFFIPIFGVAGAAWATCISIFLNTFVSLWLGQRYYPIPFPLYKILFSSMITLIIMWVGSLITEGSILHIIAKGTLIISSIISFILIRLITFDEIKSFLVQARSFIFSKQT
jgi:O-antigen/teichoic acid export membrane protein